MTKDEVEAVSVLNRDPDLPGVMGDPAEWTQATRGGQMVHESGARIQITGPSGRWVAVTSRDRTLGGRYRASYYARPSRAIRRLKEEGELRP